MFENKKKDGEFIADKIDEGGILSRNIIEVLGKPKKHVSDTVKKIIKAIESNPDYDIIKKDISTVKKQESMFSQFIEIEMLAKNLQRLVDFTFDFMPSSIEILEPEETVYKADKLNYLFNDILGTFHRMDMIIKNNAAEKELLIKNYSTLIHNAVKISIKAGAESTEDIAQATGIPEKNLKPIMEKLEDKGSVKRRQK